MNKQVFVFMWVAICPAFSFAGSGYVSAYCDGDSLYLGLASADGYDTPQFLNVEARIVGSCEPAVRINPEPLPWFEGTFGIEQYSLTLVPFSEDRYVEYRLYREDSDGNRYPVPSSGDAASWDYNACSPEAVFGRGTIVGSPPLYQFIPCGDHCWVAMDLSFELAEEGSLAYVNTGEIVNVYGTAQVSSMPPGSWFDVTKVRKEYDPDGCDAVAVESSSWGGLKARYR